MSAHAFQFARVNATGDGDNTVIAATAGKRIRVLGYAINVNAAGVVTLQDSTASPVIYASFEFTDGGGASYAGSEQAPAFDVTTGAALEVSTATGVDCLGHITYVLLGR